MKKLLLFTFLLLMLTGCNGVDASVDPFVQRYDEAELQNQSNAVWLYSRGKTEFVEAGLDAVTEHLIARYRYDGHLVTLELEPLDAHKCQLIEEREMPLYQMRGNAATPENEIEVLAMGGAVTPYYAVWLRCETMSEAEMIENLRLFVYISGAPAPYLRITDNGPSAPSSAERRNLYLGCPISLKETHINAEGDTLELVNYGERSSGKWEIWRYENFYWHETACSGAPFEPGKHSIALDLPDGFYKIMVQHSTGSWGYETFGVGELSNLSIGDLPQGERVDPIDGMWLEMEKESYSIDDEFACRARNTRSDYAFYEHRAYYYLEILLDGQWHALPFNFDMWHGRTIAVSAETDAAPPYIQNRYYFNVTHSGGHLFELIPGQYRMTLGCQLKASSKLGLGYAWTDSFSLAAEFSLK